MSMIKYIITLVKLLLFNEINKKTLEVFLNVSKAAFYFDIEKIRGGAHIDAKN